MKKKVIAFILSLTLIISNIVIAPNVDVGAYEHIDIIEKEGDEYTLENYVTSLKEAQDIQRYNFKNNIMDYSITIDYDADFRDDITNATFFNSLDGPESKYIPNPSLYYSNPPQKIISINGAKKYRVLCFNDLKDWSAGFERAAKKRSEMLEIKKKFLETIPNYEEMSDYDKVLGILRYMGDMEYNYDKHVNDAYTALTTRKATCVGFTEAFRYLATIVGLDTVEMGSAIHAWAAIKLCNNWYEQEPQSTIKETNVELCNLTLSTTLFLRGSNYFSKSTDATYKDSNNYRKTLPISRTDYSSYSNHDYSSYDIVWDNNKATFYKKCSVCGEYESNGIKYNEEKPYYYHYVDREYIGTDCDVQKVSETKCGDGTVTKYKATVTVDGKEYSSEHTVISGKCNHDAKEKIIKDSTCTTEGILQKTCKTCGYTWTESIPLKKHDYKTYTENIDTCQKKEDTEVTKCSVCGKIKLTKKTLYYAIHNYELKDTVNPTCTKEGKYIYKCSKCGDEKTETIAALGHGDREIKGYKKPTCTEMGYTGDIYCKRCGKIVEWGKQIDATDHKIVTSREQDKDSGIITINNIKYKTMIVTKKCSVCGVIMDQYEENEKIEETNTSNNQGTNNTTNKNNITTAKNNTGGNTTDPGKSNKLKLGKVKLKVKNIKIKKAKLTWNKIKYAKKYQVQFALNKKFTKSKKTKTTTKTSYIANRLKKNKKYYFRVRAVSGKKYGKWSFVKTVTIKK